MIPSLLHFVAGLASVHSFTFVLAASPEPTTTAAPSIPVAQPPGPSPPPLSDILYPYSALPEQAYPYSVGRGPQYGYNLCNSTTEGPDSLCQTLIVNDIVCLLSFKQYLTYLTILPSSSTFACGAHLIQMARLETRKPGS